MSSNAKKNYPALLLGFVVLLIHVFFAEVARFINEEAPLPLIVSPETLKEMRVTFIIITVIDLLVPWLIYKGMTSFLSREQLLFFKIIPKYAILIIGYIWLSSPVIYGLILFFNGAPITDLYYYVFICVVGTLAWGIFNFKNSPVDSSTSRD